MLESMGVCMSRMAAPKQQFLVGMRVDFRCRRGMMRLPELRSRSAAMYYWYKSWLPPEQDGCLHRRVLQGSGLFEIRFLSRTRRSFTHRPLRAAGHYRQDMPLQPSCKMWPPEYSGYLSVSIGLQLRSQYGSMSWQSKKPLNLSASALLNWFTNTWSLAEMQMWSCRFRTEQLVLDRHQQDLGLYRGGSRPFMHSWPPCKCCHLTAPSCLPFGIGSRFGHMYLQTIRLGRILATSFPK